MGISPNTARGYLALVGFVLNFALLHCGCVYAISAYDLLMPETAHLWDGQMFYWMVLHCISYIVNAARTHMRAHAKLFAKERTTRAFFSTFIHSHCGRRRLLTFHFSRSHSLVADCICLSLRGVLCVKSFVCFNWKWNLWGRKPTIQSILKFWENNRNFMGITYRMWSGFRMFTCSHHVD